MYTVYIYIFLFAAIAAVTVILTRLPAKIDGFLSMWTRYALKSAG